MNDKFGYLKAWIVYGFIKNRNLQHLLLP